MTALRIALIASTSYPIIEPFAGGLEAQTWALAHGLRERGHEVSLFAAPGSDPGLHARELEVRTLRLSDDARSDVSMPSETRMAEHHAYLTLMLELMSHGGRDFDVVHNNSLHYLPVAMARAITVPIVTTLHTPPTPWLESALHTGPCPVTFVAVSESTATAWRSRVPGVGVVPNGVDLGLWQQGAGGGPFVWSGRMVAEKGPDLAVRAARDAGVAMTLAGPVSDPRYFREQVQPLLGADVSYAGHLDRRALADLVGTARAAVVTPRWDEPYGLVAAEALACGTPVIGFARGGLREVVDERCSALVTAEDVTALTAVMAGFDALGLDRAAARRRAERHCAVEQMIDAYEALYRELSAQHAA